MNSNTGHAGMQTMVDLLRHRTLQEGQKPAYIFLGDGEGVSDSLTYAELDARARSIAQSLLLHGRPGDRVLLLFPAGLDYVAAFFGSLYAGMIAVPAYPPSEGRRSSDGRLLSIVTDAQVSIVLTNPYIADRIKPIFGPAPGQIAPAVITFAGHPYESGEKWSRPPIDAGSVAFLQYTSGSTASPRGVMISHENLLSTGETIKSCYGLNADSTVVGWLPLYHDMGLIGNVLQPLYVGAKCVLMSPSAFLQNPLRWFRAISDFKGYASGGPNFAYELCVQRISPERCSDIDLSSWNVAFNGAEPVRRETLDRFYSKFSSFGFRRESFYPCYGLAEASLFVAGRKNPARHGSDVGVPSAPSLAPAVGCGMPDVNTTVVVLRPETLELCPPGESGEICVSGPTVARGYWNHPELNRRKFGIRIVSMPGLEFLRTGDIGYLAEGEVFVTGRLSDLVIVRGRNHHPEDIEWSIQELIRSAQVGGTAAFGAEISGQERLVICQEVRARNSDELKRIAQEIRAVIASEHEISVHTILFIKPGNLPRTSSGKVQRHLCRDLFLNDSLPLIEMNVIGGEEPVAAPPQDDVDLLENARAGKKWALQRYMCQRVAGGAGMKSLTGEEPLISIGVDSLQALELKGRIESDLGVELKISEILGDRSSFQVADRIAELLTQKKDFANEPVDRGQQTGPLSYSQRALWFIHQLDRQSPAYNIARAIRIAGNLDVAALQRAFQGLAEHHDLLRMTFVADEAGPVQRRMKVPATHFVRRDVFDLDWDVLKTQLAEESRRPFDLAQGPLMRVVLLRRGPGEHILLLVVHHIVVDLWSFNTILSEVGVRYEDELHGSLSVTAHLKHQFADFVRLQQHLLSGPEGEQRWNYWKNQLAGDLEALYLAPERERPSETRPQGAEFRLAIPSDLTQTLILSACGEGTTFFTLLMTAINVVLSRHSGQEQFLIGLPASFRSLGDFSDTVGLFADPIVLRVDIAGDPTFSALVRKTSQTIIEALDHQYPFSLLVERLRPDRKLNELPLVSVLVAFQQSAPGQGADLTGLALSIAGSKITVGKLDGELLSIGPELPPFDLVITVAVVQERLEVLFQYRADKLERSRIENIASHLQALLRAIPEKRTRHLSEFDILSEAERRLLLEERNDTAVLHEDERRIHEMFQQQAKRIPDSIAVVGNSQSLSYRELDRRSNRLAHFLRGLGVGQETLVGICMDRSVEMVVSLLGILKAGGAWVALEPGLPSERLRFMAGDVQIKVLLTEERYRDLVKCDVPGICIDEIEEELARQSGIAVDVKLDNRNLSHVIYTSGSTGSPKGVCIEHGSAAELVKWAGRIFNSDELSGVCACTSLGFDLSVFEVFAPLGLGGKVVVLRNAIEILEWTGTDHLSLVNTVPSAMAELMRIKGLPASVRTINLAGEGLPRHLVQQLYGETQVRRVLNLYGPTEDTTYSTYACLAPGEEGTVPIGNPISNTQAYVLDENFNPLPAGVVGGLYLAGAGLARGYANRADQTAERFVPNRFQGRAGDRLYRTGDRARWSPSGTLEFLGRQDDQVKIRGYRIEPGEIEVVLSQCQGVKQAAVVAREDKGVKRLVGYVVAEEGAHPTGTQLRRELRERLPEYMVPEAIVVLDAMPQTSSMKIDRKRLPVPEFRSDGAGNEREMSPVEELLTGVWARVLDVEAPGLHENFFDIGGHSLLATQVTSRISASLGVELSLRTIFEEPTIARLAKKIEQELKQVKKSESLMIRRVERTSRLPLSFAQQRLWFLNQIEPENYAYNESMVLHIAGPLNEEALDKAIGTIVRRHEVLRTSYGMEEGQPAQRIHPFSGWNVRKEEAAGVGQAKELVRKELEKGFDLAIGPVLRTTLIRLGKHEHVLVVCMHHIAGDGWSSGVLAREMEQFYEAELEQRDAKEKDLEIQYADYANWQREWMTGDILEQQLRYWRKQLAGVTVLDLPADGVRSGTGRGPGGQLKVEIDEDLARKLILFTRTRGVSLFMTLMAGYQLLLGRYCGQEDVAVGTVIANRTRVETEDLIGFLANTLVVRTLIRKEGSFLDLVEQVRQTVLEGYCYQDLPFERLVEDLMPNRIVGQTPLFQAALIVQNTPETLVRIKGLEVKEWESGQWESGKSAKFDLAIVLRRKGEKLEGTLEYAAELFAPERMQNLLTHWKQVLEQGIATPDKGLWDIELLSQAEKRQLLESWNATQEDVPQLCMHEIFEEQAAKNPNSVAAVRGGEHITYEELNKRSSQLTNYLRTRGVRMEAPVAVCCDRGPDLIVALLGILKAGGVYVPLDSGYPLERIEWMLKDSRACLIVTQERLKTTLKPTGVPVVAVDSDWPEIAAAERTLDREPTTPDNLAYLIYTSGSTGQPRAVAVEHRSVVRLANSTKAFRAGGGEVFALHSPVTFDASTFELWGALLNGARLAVATESRPTLEELGEFVERERVTVLWLTAPLFHRMVEGAVHRLGSVRQLLAGGDVVSVEHVRRAAESLPHCAMINGYGPTENTTFTACYRWTGGQLKSFPIGKPISNTSVYVLDEHGELLPVGVAGELYTGGLGLARGYVNQVEQTAERFIPNRFAGKPGERLYRTGDMVRWSLDGTLEFLGRQDDQVKILGYRIEPGEIEGVLSQCEGVMQAVVVPREDASERRLVGYVVMKEGAVLTGRELRRQLKKKLPEYMVPSAVVLMKEIPLTSSGKVDRKKLPAPDSREPGERGAEEQERSPVEELLVDVWAEVLKVEKPHLDDNFFDLGGHSLLATQVMSKVRSLFGVHIPLRALFEQPTIAELAKEIERQSRKNTSVPIPPLRRGLRDRRMPLSFAQQRLWFIEEMYPGRGAYNIPCSLRLQGELRVEALQKSFTELVRRHEALRTRFEAEDGQAWQVIGDAFPIWIPIEDLTGLETEEREREAGKRTVQEGGEPFDLRRGPLLRVKLLKLGEQEHVLLVTMHHIVSDGWSIGVMVREFVHLYGAYLEGKESRLAELELQYVDYAVWQRQWLQGAALEEQVSYWRKQLAEAPVLELPTDHPRSALKSDGGGRLSWSLPEELNGELKRTARQQGATLFMTLLTALQVLLSRYSGQKDISVGTAVAGRRWAETEGLIGFFVNTLVLRTGVSGRESFQELLNRVKQTTLEAYGNQDVPFEKLVEELHPERALERTPLFQVMLVLQNMPSTVLELPKLRIERREGDLITEQFELTLTATETDGRVSGSLRYRRGLYQEATMSCLLEHWKNLLSEMVREPGRAIRDLAMLSAHEREQLVTEWNRTEESLPEIGVHRLLELQAKRRPQAWALRFGKERLSYQELNRRANQVAHLLRGLGVGVETAVGLCCERSVELIVGMVGILKAGSFYVPLDPRYPTERLAWMLEDSAVSVILTQERFVGTLPSGWAQVVTLDGDPAEKEAQSSEDPGIEMEWRHLAYVMYTSGSRGRPKGVAVEHGAIVRLVTGAKAASVEESEVMALLSPVTFDASTFEIWGALANGAELAVAAESTLSLEELGKFVQEMGVTVLWLTTGLFHQVVNEQLEPLKRVRQLLTGGDVVLLPDIKRARAALPECVLINGYGPTENAVFTTCHRMYGEVTEEYCVPIGRPITNTTVFVLDEEMRPVPAGVAGDLYTGGQGLARGYVNQVEQTAESFVPNPFSIRGGERMYRTGDWARWRRTGELEFLGRLDDQVKLRGYRIELGEIEEVLRRCPGVTQTVAMVREDRVGDRRLVAYVVRQGSSNKEDGLEDIREQLRRSLPEYMVPGTIITMDAMPLTANGKVDRKRLPSPTTLPGEAANDELPRTPTEELVADIWCEVLNIEHVGRRGDFFELGGHSLLATQAISRVRHVFGVELPLRILFEEPTVAGLAERIEVERKKKCSEELTAPPLRRAEPKGRMPMSFAQQRLWFIDQIQPGRATYNMPFAMRLEGILQTNALERAFTELVGRHEVLRTRFEEIEGEPWQVIEEPRSVAIAVEDLSGLEAEERERKASIRAREEALRPFDLQTGPLLRVKLLKLGDQTHVLLVTMHHIVSDGWSLGVMVREFAALYRAFNEGQSSPLADLEMQYADYAVWQRDWLREKGLDAQMDYWRNQLAALPVLEILTDSPRTTLGSDEGASLEWNLAGELTSTLKEVARRNGATLFMTLLAAFQVLLSRYAGLKDFAVGSPIAGRRWKETEGLIGLFVNTLVIRADLDGKPDLEEVLRRVKETTLSAYSHQDVPFEKLVAELQPERDLERTPLFQVMFVLQNMPPIRLELPDLKLLEMKAELPTEKFEMTLMAAESGGQVTGELSYRKSLFQEKGMKRLLQHWKNLLEEMVKKPKQTITEWTMLSSAEREQLRMEWHGREQTYPQHCVHEFFEQQVQKRPEAVAVVCANQRLSYRVLNERANELGHYLRTLGVGPEILCAVCMERSPEMVIGLMAILKAGGAYVPLDPGFPADRIRYVLEDCAASVLLTQEGMLDRLPSWGGQVICVDDRPIKRKSLKNMRPVVTPDNLAYVIYTSGSTGRPKGVAVAHRGVATLKHWAQEVFSGEELQGVLASTSICFDVSAFEILVSLGCGGRLLLVDNALSISQMTGANEVRVITTVPSAMQELLPIGAIPDSVSAIGLAGEAIPARLVSEIYEAGKVGKVLNIYGPTEDTIYSTWAQLSKEAATGASPIGHSITGRQSYILDDEFDVVPIGVAGELYLGGAGLARGYVNRADLTAERFVPNPFSETGGERLYRTGDQVCRRADGGLEFMGRLDSQLKVRGFRIEPGEIESVLGDHPNVQAAVVLAQKETAGASGLRLLACVKPGAQAKKKNEQGSADWTEEISEWRGYLKERLPDWMVPSAWLVMHQFPLTVSGKVDRKALAAHGGAILGKRKTENPKPPQSQTEKKLAEIWKELLEVENVGVDDDFFELGGHSLLATRLISRVRSTLGVDIPLRTLFAARDLATFAMRIDQARRELPGRTASVISPLNSGTSEIESLLAEIEDLSEPEVDRILAEQQEG